MTSERELEALAAQWDRDAEGCDRDGYRDAGIVKRDCARRLRELARRLQPARVPEVSADVTGSLERIRIAADHGGMNEGQCYSIWRTLSAALLAAAPAAEGGMAEPVAWMTDSPYVCNSLTNDKTVADMWRERGWNVAPLGVIDTTAPESREAETMRDFAEEIGTNGKPTGYFIFDKPEAGQREGVELPEAPPCPVWLDDASKAWGLGWEACRKEAIRRLASAQQVGTKCWCETCRPQTMADMRFIVCPDCGNKRCPRANDHRNACTNSNETGQPGSSWAHVKPAQRTGSRGEGGDG